MHPSCLCLPVKRKRSSSPNQTKKLLVPAFVTMNTKKKKKMKTFVRSIEIGNELSHTFVEFEGLWMSWVNEPLSFVYICLFAISLPYLNILKHDSRIVSDNSWGRDIWQAPRRCRVRGLVGMPILLPLPRASCLSQSLPVSGSQRI